MSQQGYSILEFIIVTAISTVLAFATLYTLGDQIEVNKINATQTKINSIKQALENYRIKYNALPCPASFTTAQGSAQYGVATTNCASTCSSGTFCGNGFVIGAVRIQNLGLGNDFSLDNWDNKIAYAVDSRFTQQGICQVNGQLTINTNMDSTTSTVTSTANYVILSYGKDSRGAYNSDGVLKAACNSSDLDGVNCGNSGVFLGALVNMSSSASIHYDDVIVWNTNSQALKCPAGVAGCSLWLDAADVCSITTSTNNVSSWLDKSTSQLNAVATGTNQPSFVNTPTSLINHNPYITFNGSNLMNISSSSIPPNTNFTEIMVMRTTNNSNAVITIAADSPLYTSNGNREFGLENSGSIAFSIDNSDMVRSVENCGTSSPYCADGSPHIATITADSTNGQTLYINGIIDGSSLVTTTSLVNQSNILIGGHHNWGYYTGDLLEVIIYDRVLTLAEIKAVEKYLASKWNIGKYNP